MKSAMLAIVAAALVTSAALADTDVGVVGNQIKVPAGRTDSQQIAILFATGPEIVTQPPDKAVVTDISGNAGGVTVTFGDVKNIGIAKAADGKVTRYEWQAAVDVKGLQANTSQTRQATIDVNGGAGKRTFAYELTNKATALTWTLNAPPSAVAVAGADTPLRFSVVVNGEGGPTRVVVSRMTLRDAANRLVPKDAVAVENNDVPLGTVVPLTLTVKGASIPAGNYTGNVELAAVGAADAKTFDLAIASSPSCGRLIGFFCVLGGVLVALGLGNFLRNYSARLTALVPATQLRAIVARERATLQGAGTTSNGETKKWLDEIGDALSDDTLTKKQYIPPVVPLAFGSNIDTAGYTKYLQEQTAAIERVSYLIDRGFALVKNYPADPAKQQEAYEDLDALAVSRPADIKTPTDAIIAGLKPPQPEGVAPAAKERAELSVEQLLVRVEVISLTAWIIWAIVSAIVGYLAAVNVAGFGVMADYLKAFLWGLGLQTAGTLSQLTPSSVASTIGVTLPKTSG